MYFKIFSAPSSKKMQMNFIFIQNILIPNHDDFYFIIVLKIKKYLWSKRNAKTMFKMIKISCHVAESCLLSGNPKLL